MQIKKTRDAVSTVDVVIPCYNYARYLRGCVQSVLTQPGVKVRVLIIDDASPDDTAKVGQELADIHEEVEFRRHEVNKGHITTYNEGLLGWSKADYVILLSADDLLSPGALARATRIMDADPAIGMVYGRTIHFQSESDLPTLSTDEAKATRFWGAKWVEMRCRAGHNVITSPEVVVRGSIQKSVGGYRPELPHSGDLEMWLRIAAVSNIAYVHGVQAFYRVHQSSMQRTQFRGNFLDLIHRKAAFDLFFQHHPNLSNIDHLREMADRALAREALWDACRAYDRDRIDDVRVDELIEFAMNTYSAARSLPEYAALRRRQRIGAAICRRTQIFAPAASIHLFNRWLKRQRMLRYGI